MQLKKILSVKFLLLLPACAVYLEDEEQARNKQSKYIH
jgi:hypothetical protein